MSTTAPILSVRNLTKHFTVGTGLSRHTVRAVQDVSFDLHRGEVLALVGESGSGKSTTARLITRLYPPTGGQILFKDQDVLRKRRGDLLRYRRELQMIFQDPFSSLNPVHIVFHHLERPLQIHSDLRGPRLRARVDELLTTVGLTPAAHFAAKYPHQLSGGQRQRVAIARALAVDPEAIVADEPVSMLDVSIRMGILNLMARMKQERGIAFLYITHDLASARYFADRTMVMYAGSMVEWAESESLVQSPAHPYTRLLLSAVPDPSRGLRTRQIDARGEIPTAGGLGPGCPFAGRCPAVRAVCRQAIPPIREVAPGHFTRCYLYSAPSEGEPPPAMAD